MQDTSRNKRGHGSPIPLSYGWKLGGSHMLHTGAAQQSLQGNSTVMGENIAPFYNHLKFQGNFSDSGVEIYREILPLKGKKGQKSNSHKS